MTLSAQGETEQLKGHFLNSKQIKNIAIELASKRLLERDTSIYKSKIKTLELKNKSLGQIVLSMKDKEEANKVYTESLKLDYDEAYSGYLRVASENIDLEDKVKKKNKFIYVGVAIGFIVGTLSSR